MKQPWLIARGNFNGNSIRYDYMGSAEFEFNAVPDSWKRLALATIMSEILISAPNGKVFIVYVTHAPDFPIDEYEKFIQKLTDGDPRLKEETYFDRVLKYEAGIEKTRWILPDVWHDIENDVLFSLNQENLSNAITHIVQIWRERLNIR